MTETESRGKCANDNLSKAAWTHRLGTPSTPGGIPAWFLGSSVVPAPPDRESLVCGLPQAVHSWTHTHTHTYLCFTWKWLLCYHCNNFPHRWASHPIWAVPPSHLLTSTLSICWSSFGNHSIWEKVLHCREPREEAMQRKQSCNVKDWHKFCRGIPVRRKLWETLQCFHNPPAVLLYFKCFSLLSVCCGFGLGQLFPSSCFPAFPLPLPKGVKGL